MARRIKPPTTPYEISSLHAADAHLLAPSNMPTDGGLRGEFIIAFMKWLQEYFPDAYNHGMAASAVIAKFEAVPDERMPADQKRAEIVAELERLASEPPSRDKHNKLGIEVQREQLRDLLTRENYAALTMARQRLSWIRERWDQIIALLSLTPCKCQPYRTSRNSFLKHADNRLPELATVRDMTDLLLAYVHKLNTVSAENLRKTLKPRS